MNEYPGNSYVSKSNEKQKEEPQQALAPVVTGDVQVRKKTVFSKIASKFFAEDITDVKSYVVNELLIPGLKRAFLNSLEMMLLGKGNNPKPGSSNVVDQVSYRDYWDAKYNQKKTVSQNTNNYLEYDALIYVERGDAEVVLEQMRDILRQFHVVRVSDMFEISKKEAPYTGNRYGWTDLSSAMVIHVNGGYMIKMPRAMVLE